LNLKAQQTFEEIKNRLTLAQVLAFSCIKKVFKVQSDAFSMAIGGVLTQEDR